MTESSKTSQVPQEIMSPERNEGIIDSLRENFNLRGAANNDSVTSKTSRTPQETISQERTEGILNSLRENLKVQREYTRLQSKQRNITDATRNNVTGKNGKQSERKV